MRKHINPGLYISVIILMFGIITLSSCSCDRNNNSVKINGFKNYQDAVNVGDFESAHLFLYNYHKCYLDATAAALSGSERVWGIRNKEQADYVSSKATYYDAFEGIYKAEIRLIITTMEGQEACDKIVFLLDEIPIDGKQLPQGINHWTLASSGHSLYYEFDPYLAWARHFNDLCNSVLVLAINRKNKVLAEQILQHYVDAIEVFDENNRGREDIPFIESSEAYVNYTKNDAKAAKEKYDNAVAMGIFN